MLPNFAIRTATRLPNLCKIRFGALSKCQTSKQGLVGHINSSRFSSERLYSSKPPCKEISFHHPYYPETSNTLAKLPALDLNSKGESGLHSETARLACALLTGNTSTAWESYSFALSTDRAGENIISTDEPDALLTGEKYYLQATDHPILAQLDRYGINPVYALWLPYTTPMPRTWEPQSGTTYPSATEYKIASRGTGGRICDISGIVDRTGSATSLTHVFPPADKLHSLRRELREQEYSWGTETRSSITLSNELRDAYVAGQFAIIPKDADPVHGTRTPKVHFFDGNAPLAKMYHGLELPNIDLKVPREAMILAFARAVYANNLQYLRRLGHEDGSKEIIIGLGHSLGFPETHRLDDVSYGPMINREIDAMEHTADSIRQRVIRALDICRARVENKGQDPLLDKEDTKEILNVLANALEACGGTKVDDEGRRIADDSPAECTLDALRPRLLQALDESEMKAGDRELEKSGRSTGDIVLNGEKKPLHELDKHYHLAKLSYRHHDSTNESMNEPGDLPDLPPPSFLSKNPLFGLGTVRSTLHLVSVPENCEEIMNKRKSGDDV